MTLNQILTNPLDGETPASRLKQVALIMVIGKLQGDELPITLTRLIEITGLTRGGVGQAVGPLVQRGLLIEEMGKNAMGRGMARQFNLSPTFLETLGLINGNPIRHAK
nr:hypothetical protein [Rhizobium giardinii]